MNDAVEQSGPLLHFTLCKLAGPATSQPLIVPALSASGPSCSGGAVVEVLVSTGPNSDSDTVTAQQGEQW